MIKHLDTDKREFDDQGASKNGEGTLNDQSALKNNQSILDDQSASKNDQSILDDQSVIKNSKNTFNDNTLPKSENSKKDEKVRLNKYLSAAGVCSRRQADKYAADGKVTVNGKPVLPGCMVGEGDDVRLDGVLVKEKAEKVVIAFNKPSGVECTLDRENPDNIVDYIGYPSRIYPVGRLDKQSRGLILLTNNGRLANYVTQASNRHEKEYIVTVDKPVTSEFVSGMSKGVRIPTTGKVKAGFKDTLPTRVTRPCRVEKISEKSFRIVITQGINRQIRRMCMRFGYKVRDLKRVRIMNITLKGMPEGSYRILTDGEVEKLMGQNRER